jgi:hypothetical protein
MIWVSSARDGIAMLSLYGEANLKSESGYAEVE